VQVELITTQRIVYSEAGVRTRHLLEVRLGARADGDGRALARELHRELATEPGSDAGDDGDLVLEEHGDPFWVQGAWMNSTGVPSGSST
jgi:hypothetical protein